MVDLKRYLTIFTLSKDPTIWVRKNKRKQILVVVFVSLLSRVAQSSHMFYAEDSDGNDDWQNNDNLSGRK